jgi:hypothetical protein
VRGFDTYRYYHDLAKKTLPTEYNRAFAKSIKTVRTKAIVFAVSHPKSIIFATGNQSVVENLTAACPLYNSFVLLYNGITLLDRSRNGLTAPPVQTNSNTTPDPTLDKTGNNREIEFKELNLPILPTSPPPDSLVQTNSNTTPDPTPDKTGNNREIEFKELNLEYIDIPIPHGLRTLQKPC